MRVAGQQTGGNDWAAQAERGIKGHKQQSIRLSPLFTVDCIWPGKRPARMPRAAGHMGFGPLVLLRNIAKNVRAERQDKCS